MSVNAIRPSILPLRGDELGALILWAAYLELQEEGFPESLGDWTIDTVLAKRRRLKSQERIRYDQIIDVDFLWLPFDFDEVLKANDVKYPHWPVCIGSLYALLRQLETLNRNTWDIDIVELVPLKAFDAATLEGKAKYSFSILYSSAAKAIENNLMIELPSHVKYCS